MHILAKRFPGNHLTVCSESGSAIVLTPAFTNLDDTVRAESCLGRWHQVDSVPNPELL
jgi:hypothetical protein